MPIPDMAGRGRARPAALPGRTDCVVLIWAAFVGSMGTPVSSGAEWGSGREVV